MAFVQQKDIASSTVPSIDLDLKQGFPSNVPAFVFEVRLFNPCVGNSAGRLKGDIVTA
jgi:hypothetical protein